VSDTVKRLPEALRDQSSVMFGVPRVPEERPQEHLRNALCLIGAAERHALTCDGWDCEEMRELLHAIERRVLLTVAQLETR
jgi:hypothetical protein